MPPLTLEQVLARSMRLPRKITSRAGAVASSSLQSPSVSHPRDRDGFANLVNLIEKEEETMKAGRPTINTAHALVRNSQDLLTYLHTAKRMRAWEDALRSFSESTKLLTVHPNHENPIITRQEEVSAGVTPSDSHFVVLIDTCAEADKWQLIEQLGEAFASHSPAIVVQVVKHLAVTKKGQLHDGELYGWERALNFLQTRISPAFQPVDAYNTCIAACEKNLDWEGALAVVRSMGENPIQQFDPKSLEEANFTLPPNVTEHDENKNPGTSAGENSQRPKPTVVTYATLISVLEQTGKDRVASAVLQRLPPIEREEITASYAALIHVWSEQKSRRSRHRF